MEFPSTFGGHILKDLQRENVFSQGDSDFVQCNTNFLTHLNVMNNPYSTFKDLSFRTQLHFWKDISKQFPKEKRKLFWRLFMKTCESDISEYPPIITQLEKMVCTLTWRYIAEELSGKNWRQ